MDIAATVKAYRAGEITIGVLGSHSALDICRGAKDLGFKTLVVAQKGRERTYDTYYKTRKEGGVGCVDTCIVLDSFSEIIEEKTQQQLRDANTIFVPHRSFETYLNFDYDAIENRFHVPMFGNRKILKIEERGSRPNQYDLLKAADIRYPVQFDDASKIDRLCLVKILEKERGFERSFFLAQSPTEYERSVSEGLKEGRFTKEQVAEGVIEEFILGVQVNFNFFYSPLTQRLELLGTDTRRQTNLEGFLKTPAMYQSEILEKVTITYEEAGHIAVTVLESILEDAFALAERFVRASKKLYPPGIIGPFALQSFVTPGPPKKDIVVMDVSPRMPGSPGITSTPYGRYLFGRPMSAGDRIALEIKEAELAGALEKIIT